MRVPYGHKICGRFAPKKCIIFLDIFMKQEFQDLIFEKLYYVLWNMFKDQISYLDMFAVAPLAGAWIEIV